VERSLLGRGGAGARRTSLDVALVIPQHGPAGIVGLSCELCALLAVEELNAAGGLLGREVRLVIVDGARTPDRVADEVDLLVTAGAVDAVTGWHTSAVRQAVSPRIAQRVPYVYTPLYEGGERTPGVFLAGETPGRQLAPAIRWLADQLAVRTWCIVGDDYVWPRVSAAAARHYVREGAGEVLGETFVRFGRPDFGLALRMVRETGCDAVLMLLVGQDAVAFNRAFARAGLQERCLRLSPLMEENMLLASGVQQTAGLYSAAGYFEALPTADNLSFTGRFAARFGVDAPPLNSLGESCYEGVRLLAELVGAAGSLEVRRICATAESVAYQGPRGVVRIEGGHLHQQVYLAQARGLDFDVLAAL
jgi:ABC-type branched-subunit amino acid transport system substrate-binding protein